MPNADEGLKLDASPQSVGEARGVQIELVAEPSVRGANIFGQLIPRLSRLVRRKDFEVLGQKTGCRPWLGLRPLDELV